MFFVSSQLFDIYVQVKIMKTKKKTGVVVNVDTLAEEQRIRQAFKDKDWAEIKGANSWMIFKVMSEFVEGLEKLAKIGPCVTIFGSARVRPSNPFYKMADEIAFQLVHQDLLPPIQKSGPEFFAYENNWKPSNFFCLDQC